MVAMYREARERAALTAQQAATQLDISITTLLSWENGKTAPSALKLVELFAGCTTACPMSFWGFVEFQK